MVLRVLVWVLVVLAFVGAGYFLTVPSTGLAAAVAVFLGGLVLAAMLHALANIVDYLERIAASSDESAQLFRQRVKPAAARDEPISSRR